MASLSRRHACGRSDDNDNESGFLRTPHFHSSAAARRRKLRRKFLRPLRTPWRANGTSHADIEVVTPEPRWLAKPGRKLMIRLIAFAAFAIAVTTSAQAMPLAPLHEADSMITKVALGCGPGRTRVAGVCVARTTIRHTRRHARRCAVWGGSTCLRYY